MTNNNVNQKKIDELNAKAKELGYNITINNLDGEVTVPKKSMSENLKGFFAKFTSNKKAEVMKKELKAAIDSEVEIKSTLDEKEIVHSEYKAEFKAILHEDAKVSEAYQDYTMAQDEGLVSEEVITELFNKYASLMVAYGEELKKNDKRAKEVVSLMSSMETEIEGLNEQIEAINYPSVKAITAAGKAKKYENLIETLDEELALENEKEEINETLISVIEAKKTEFENEVEDLGFDLDSKTTDEPEVDKIAEIDAEILALAIANDPKSKELFEDLETVKAYTDYEESVESAEKDLAEAVQAYVDAQVELAEETKEENEISKLVAEKAQIIEDKELAEAEKKSKTTKKILAEAEKKSKTTKKILAGVGVVIMVGVIIVALKQCSTDKKTVILETPEDTKKTEEEGTMVSQETTLDVKYLTFDPNNNNQVVDRVAGLFVNTNLNGIADIQMEDYLNFYYVLNIHNLEADDFAQLQETKTMEELTRSFDIVSNAIHDDAMTMTPDTMPNISKFIADKESAAAFNTLQTLIAEFNVASVEDKEAEAAEINKFIKEFYATNEFVKVESPANVLMLKMLSGIEKLTINTDYRVPSEALSAIVFGSATEAANCNLTSSDISVSRYGQEKHEVRNATEAFLAMVSTQVLNANYLEQATEADLEALIAAQIELTGYKVIPNPSLTDAIMDSKPADATVEDPDVVVTVTEDGTETTKTVIGTVEATDIVTIDENTNETIIVKTEEEVIEIKAKLPEVEVVNVSKEAYDQAVQDVIDHKDPSISIEGKTDEYVTAYLEGLNFTNAIKIEAHNAASIIGVAAGKADGEAGNTYDPTPNTVTGTDIYVKFYGIAYRRAYELQYNESIKMHENTTGSIQTEGKVLVLS